MSKENILEKLKKNYADPQSILIILKMHQFINENLEEITREFIKSLDAYCQKIKEQQTTNEKNKISYIHFSILRTALREKDHRLRIDAYDQTYYADKHACTGYYHAGWALKYYEEYLDYIELNRRPFVWIKKHQLLDMAEEELQKYTLYISHIIRKMLNNPAAEALLDTIDKEEIFIIRVGEYLDKSDIVYKQDKTIKDPIEIKTKLENYRQDQFIYEIVPGLDLSKGNYQNKNISFSDLSHCNLSHSNLENTIMENTKLTAANLTEANLSQTTSLNTDYSNANLTGSKFNNALLINASFKNAKIHQANFDQATLINPDFAGAEITETNIPKTGD